VLQAVQQSMVYLTMLLSSRNLWMRPAVLEAPAQDPQYLEAIHRVSRGCQQQRQQQPCSACCGSLAAQFANMYMVTAPATPWKKLRS
jgi:hypothetical protein